MSSINSRIVIEHYENGGFGVFIDGDDNMGLDKGDVSAFIDEWLEDKS